VADEDDLNDLLGPKPEPEPEPAPKPKPKRATKASGRKGYVSITLEENENIPPTGLFVGMNGRGYLLKPGEKADVPQGVVDILDNAIMSTPIVDPSTKRVVGHRDRMRYPYRRH